ncbi:MAG: DUF262 domain-containing protein [Fimbriimonadaceae bacterium]|nr:DUF262 domain-containing protein [Fimbriimonadaceae bacterium]
MASTARGIETIKSEVEDGYSDDSLFNIKPWGADLSFRELIDRYNHDELVKPELQRNYVWDRREASRFIDSLLLGLPVPSIFLAQTKAEKLLIIDGYQRIMTVRDFVRGIFSGDDKAFALSRTEKINARWRGKQFSELTDAEQRRIRNTTIHAIIFAQQKEPQTDDTSLFQVFERINTSGRTLTAQEIRNCVAQGAFNKLLFRLNDLPTWRALFGSKEPDPRMRDMELILRFFALSAPSFASAKERLSLRQHLDIFMKSHADINATVEEEMTSRFTAMVNRAHRMFGPSAFQNTLHSKAATSGPKFSPTIFDSISIAIDISLKSDVAEPINAQERKSLLLTDAEYRRVIAQETMRKSSITKRIEKACYYLFSESHE